jgi:hypothetical protein
MLSLREDATTRGFPTDAHVSRDSRSRQAWLIALTLLALPAVDGCRRHDGPERVVVSGSVTYQGKPIAYGTILFVPQTASDAPMSAATIHDSKYSADAHGGVPIGTHKVVIEAIRVVGGTGAPSNGPLPGPGTGERQQYIPDKYNVKTQLSITVPPGGSSITKDFELTN